MNILAIQPEVKSFERSTNAMTEDTEHEVSLHFLSYRVFSGIELIIY